MSISVFVLDSGTENVEFFILTYLEIILKRNLASITLREYTICILTSDHWMGIFVHPEMKEAECYQFNEPILLEFSYRQSSCKKS